MRSRSGEVLDLRGVVAPSGAIFFRAADGERDEVLLIAHRRTDTLFVDWAGFPTSTPGRSRDVYSPGIMRKVTGG